MLPDTLLDKIKEIFESYQDSGSWLEDIKWIDWGGGLPPMPSTQFPLIFFTINDSIHPEKRAAKGKEESYDDHYSIAITVASYIVKTSDGTGGYKAAMQEAANLFRSVKTICHLNKKWDDLCYTSEFAEDDEVDWGLFPLGATSTDIAYGITAIMRCRAKGHTSSSSSSSSST